MRNINGDEGNIGFFENVGDVGSYVLFYLELQHQVDPLAHKLLGILDCDVGVIAIIQLQQLNARRRCSRGNAGSHGYREGHFRTLRREAEAQSARPGHQAILPALSLRDIAAVHQRFQNPIHAGLGNIGLLVHIFQRDGTVGLLQQLQHIQRLREDRDEVEPFDPGFCQPPVPPCYGSCV